MSGTSEIARVRYTSGSLHEITIEDVNEFHSPAAVLEQRLVRVNNVLFVRKYVSRAAGAREAWRYDRLTNEVRACTRLVQAYGERFPSELPFVAAYNVDAEEPFVLIREYIGQPLASAMPRSDSERRQAEIGLFRALNLLARAGVVHGAVSLDALRWHNGLVQIVDFESAARVGENRRGVPGTVDPRDDLWNAAVVLRRLTHQVWVGDVPPRSQDPDRLRGLVEPIFDQPVEHRPGPEQILVRMRADTSTPGYTDPERGLLAGHEEFDRANHAKRQLSGAGADSANHRPGRWRRMFGMGALLVLAFARVGGTK